MFGTAEETGLIPYKSLLDTVEPLLDEYEFSGLRIRYLSPEKTPEVVRLIQKLSLAPFDLNQPTLVASEGFHNVALQEATEIVM